MACPPGPCRRAKKFTVGQAFTLSGPHVVDNRGEVNAGPIITQIARPAPSARSSGRTAQAAVPLVAPKRAGQRTKVNMA